MRPPLRRAARLLRPLAAGVLLLGSAACTGGSGDTAERSAAYRFLDAIGSGAASTAAAATDTPTVAVQALRRDVAGLGAKARGSFTITRVRVDHTRASVAFTAKWKLTGTDAHWTYSGSMPLTQRKGTWRVHWRDADIHPRLRTGEHLVAQLVQPVRAALLDRAGQPLAEPTPVVTVGIEPKLATNLARLATTLARIPELQSTRSEILAAAKSARPTDFVPVITVRRPVYERIKPRIYNLPGTVFQSATQLLGPTAHFGQPLLGSVGPATRDVVDSSNGRVAAGQSTGLGGLQQAFDRRLAGTPGVTVVAAPDTGDGTARRLSVVSAPRAADPIRLTIDRRLQTLAERSLAGLPKAASLVVVQRSTGRILVDANNDRTTYDYGLSGAFPPGSTFKIATWTAAFEADPALTTHDKVACPGSTDVDGRHFVNENRFSHPPIPISAAFGYSCNTSAIAEILKLPLPALATAARNLGLGVPWTLPVPAFSGTVPAPASATERAADSIGQGRVLASPLLMALMASAADGGKVLAPSLTMDTKPAAGTTLPTTITARMHTLMAATVDLPGGTGHALADAGGVIGKTGTAEYGTARPPRSHSWFAGVRGDLAVAAFVYDGATTHVDAVPVVRAFLRAS